MNNIITYTNHQGRSITFGDDPLNYFKHGLFDYEWSYSERNGRVSSFDKPLQEKDFPVGVFAETEEEGLAARNAIYEVADVDVMMRKPGTLRIGEWELLCYIIRSQADMYWISDKICELHLTVLAEKPNWIRKRTKHFSFRSEEAEKSDFLNYPYNYPYNYTRRWTTQKIINESMAPCDFILRIYGVAEDPYVMIGDNLYQVNVTVPNGSRLEINSREQTIEIIDSVGRITNAYDARKLGKKGRGNYIFEKIPVGYSAVLWANDFIFDLVLIEERGVPEWE